MHILFLSAWYPYPPNNGSKIRIFNLLRALAELHEVTLITYAEGHELGEPPAELKNLCKKVVAVPSRPYSPHSPRALAGFFSSEPRVLVDRHTPDMAQAIQDEVKNGEVDLVVASQWYTAAYADAFQGIPAIFEEMELGIFEDKVTRAPNLFQRLRHRLTVEKLKYYFPRLLSHFEACTVASQQEIALLHKLAPTYRAARVIPNVVHLEDYRKVGRSLRPATLIFTGSFRYHPNWEAMCWFLEQVYPRVREEVPGVQLVITGDHAGRPLPEDKNVILTGFVKDIRPLVASSWASLAPLNFGGGTRLKILESMALHTPVIATSKGAEGLDVLPGEHLLVADDPKEFAEATIRLLLDTSLRCRLSENGYRLVREQYSVEAVMPRFLELVEQLASNKKDEPGKRRFNGRLSIDQTKFRPAHKRYGPAREWRTPLRKMDLPPYNEYNQLDQ